MANIVPEVEIKPNPADELLGTWVFNDEIDIAQYSSQSFPAMFYMNTENLSPEITTPIQIAFTSNDTEYSYIGFGVEGATETPVDSIVYLAEDNPFSGTSKGWTQTVYRTITITDTSALTNRDEFTTWLKANAVKQQAEPTPSGTTITYNGSTIATLSEGQTGTLACANKKAVSDIQVAFASAGTVGYNGTETAVEAGKTATLACAGKLMKTDVVIKAASAPAGDELLGTWYFNETLSGVLPSSDVTFLSDGSTYVCLWCDGSPGAFTLVYAYPDGEDRDGPVLGIDVAYEFEWYSDAYRTITITDTSALTNRDEFTTWLKANATKQ